MVAVGEIHRGGPELVAPGDIHRGGTESGGRWGDTPRRPLSLVVPVEIHRSDNDNRMLRGCSERAPSMLRAYYEDTFSRVPRQYPRVVRECPESG